MKTIGLVGITWLSSAGYFKHLNEMVNRRLGGSTSARCILYSLNFADVEALNDRRDWATTLELVTGVCQRLSAAGADCIMLGANTMHVIADDLRDKIDVPLIHMPETTADVLQQRGLRKVGLLGTKFTMEMDFFKRKLAARGLATVVPSEADREFIHATIFGELTKGVVTEATKRRYLSIIDGLAAEGAEGVVLGCTEIPLLIGPEDCSFPTFDTMAIHAEAAVAFALGA